MDILVLAAQTFRLGLRLIEMIDKKNTQSKQNFQLVL